jgi:hypothetical protein
VGHLRQDDGGVITSRFLRFLQLPTKRTT